MSRPIKERSVCSLPGVDRFGPLNPSQRKDSIIMTVDEYESLRLIDMEGLKQEECAIQMNIARTTVQGIYARARKKVAEALVNGNILVIEGGRYELCDGVSGCGRSCVRGRGRRGRHREGNRRK